MNVQSQTRASVAALIPARGHRIDGDDIERGVRAHCLRLGASESTTVAACSFALRAAGTTLAAIRVGRQRADQLHARDLSATPPNPA